MGPRKIRRRPRSARLRSVGFAACPAMLLAACGGAASSAHVSNAAQVPVSRQYLAIATAGNRHLEHDFDGLRADHGDLQAARAYLRDAATTERLFDRRLLRLSLPARAEVI